MADEYFNPSNLEPGDMIISSGFEYFGIVELLDEQCYYVRWNHMPERLQKYEFQHVVRLDSNRVIRDKHKQLEAVLKHDYSQRTS